MKHVQKKIHERRGARCRTTVKALCPDCRQAVDCDYVEGEAWADVNPHLNPLNFSENCSGSDASVRYI